MRRALAHQAGAALAAVVAAAGLVLWSGVVDIGARRGHWAITHELLAFAMRRSVVTHAGARRAPPLDDPALVSLGLAHYDAGCAPCHGSPGHAPNPVFQQTVPAPPNLAEGAQSWSDAQLFWIVMNGVKYTSMPAWPAPERDDEVWAVVAGLRQLPTLGRDEYRRIVRGDLFREPGLRPTEASLIAAAGPLGHDLLACARCHGLRGEGGGAGAFPSLAGLTEGYIVDSLESYALGARPSGVMQPIAAALSEAETRALAAHFASFPLPVPAQTERPTIWRRGRDIAQRGRSEAGAAPCDACHGAARAGSPRLAGQHAPYLLAQLQLWRRGVRGGSSDAPMMSAALGSLGDPELRALSACYGTQRGQAP